MYATLRSSVHFIACVRGSFARLFETRLSSNELSRIAVERKHHEMEFARKKTEFVPFVIYADFESCLIPVHDNSGVLDGKIPSGFCAYTVSTDPEFEAEPVTYSGRDCMKAFYNYLAKEQHRIASIVEECHEKILSTRENRNVSIQCGRAPLGINRFRA
jgi:hypothetical protein